MNVPLRIVLSFCLVTLLAAHADAQQTLLSGTVNDPQGAAVGVSVTLRSATGTRRDATTDADGRYRFDGLTPGAYDLSFARSGFETQTRRVSVGAEPVSVDVTLALGRLATTVDVAGTLNRGTASKLDIPDRDVPAQVSTITQEVLHEQGLNDMVTALRNVSGASTQKFFGAYENYTVRGFHTLNNTVLFLVDGMRLEGDRYNTQLNNVERIDVLKGPSSSLFGREGLSGTINVIRKEPAAAPSYEVMYRGGRFNSHTLGIGATGRLGSDALLYRADVSFDRSDGWRDAGTERLNVSPTLTWIVNDRLRLRVLQAFNRDNFDGDSGVPYDASKFPGIDLSRRFNTPQDFITTRDSQTNVLFSAAVSGHVQVRNSFFFRRTNDEYFAVDGPGYQPATIAVTRPRFYYNYRRQPVQNQTEMTGQFRILGTSHSVLAGYEFQHYNLVAKYSTSANASAPPVSLATYADTSTPVTDFSISRADNLTNNVNGVFWQDQIALSSKVQLNIGGRWDAFKNVTSTDPYSQNQPVALGPETHRHQTAYTYRAGLVFSPVQNHQIYASSASSYAPVSQISSDGRQLEPEAGRNYEIGHRFQAFGGRFNAGTAVYQLVRRNVVIAFPNQIYEQAGQQSSKGVDIDAAGHLPRGVSIVANYGYTVPRFDHYLTTNGTVDLSGFQPRITQHHSANVWVSKAWGDGFVAGAGARSVGPMFLNDTDTRSVAGWTTVNGMIGFRKGAYDWSVNAENLLNRDYLVPGAYGSLVYPSAPITVFTTIRVHFR